MKRRFDVGRGWATGAAVGFVPLLALSAAILVLGSCGYFDPLNPLDHRLDDPEHGWVKVIRPGYEGGTGSGDDRGMCVRQTADGGFVVAGYMQPRIDKLYDVWLVKTDASGNVEWKERYGDEGYDEWGYHVEQTGDGGYIIVGYRDLSSGDSEVWLIKTDAAGDCEPPNGWSRTYGEAGRYEAGYCVQVTEDGGYIITGSRETDTGNEDLWLIKTDASGNVIWDETFGGEHSPDVGRSVLQTADGGYLIGGDYISNDVSMDAYLLKTDQNGAAWAADPRYFGDPSLVDHGYCVLETFTEGNPDGYILVGEAQATSTDMDALLVKVDAAGNLDDRWDPNPKTLRHEPDSLAHDRAGCIEQTFDGGYIIAGMTHDRDQDVWLLKTDALGNPEWDRTFGEGNYEEAMSVQQTADGGYILAGYTNSYAGGANLYLIYYKP